MDHYNSPRYCRWSYPNFVWLNIFLFVVVLGTYAISRIVMPPFVLPPSFAGHFHDLLATPVLLAASNLWIVACGRRHSTFVSLRSILALSLAAGFFWEYITPLYRASTTDILDLMAYALGGILYFGVLRIFNQ